MNYKLLTPLIIAFCITQAKALATICEPNPSIIGTAAVATDSIEGTWHFDNAELVYKNKEMEKSLDSSAPVVKGKTYLQKGLTKAGFSKETTSITITSDGTFSMTIGQKTFNATYTIEGSNIIIKGAKRSLTTNIRIEQGKLQLALSASQVLALVQAASAVQATTNLSTVVGLINSMDGVYVGLVFTK